MDFAAYLDELRRARPPREDPGRGPDNLIVLEQIGSTNALARRIVAEYAKESERSPGVLLLAWEQTAGRGREGRTWQSAPGQGVYATCVLAVAEARALATLPLLVGVGLCRGLDRYLPGRAGLKWPNDLMVDGKKMGGVLIEAQVQPGEESAGLAIVGFGVNFGQEESELSAIDSLPGGTARGATSLAREGAAGGVSLATFTWALVAAVEAELAHAGDAAYAAAAYRERSVHREGDQLTCRLGEETIEGTFRGFDESGRLLIESQGEGTRPISAGDVIEEGDS